MISAVISDLDGTLVDTTAANEAAYAEAFQFAHVPFDLMAYRSAYGLRFDGMVHHVAQGVSVSDIDTIRTAKARIYPSHFGLLRSNEALVEAIETFRVAGTRTALATTAARANASAVLQHLGLERLFDVIVTGEDVFSGKPAPDCYLRAAALSEAAPKDCLVFEDSAVGVEAARAAGCHVLEVTL